MPILRRIYIASVQLTTVHTHITCTMLLTHCYYFEHTSSTILLLTYYNAYDASLLLNISILYTQFNNMFTSNNFTKNVLRRSNLAEFADILLLKINIKLKYSYLRSE